MTTKHTSGPWRITSQGLLVSDDNGMVLSIKNQGSLMTNAELQANYALIESAPEMLEALVDAEIVLGENLQFITDLADLAIRQRDSETLKRLEQLNGGWLRLVKAIAKAKGQTSLSPQDKQGEV